MHSAPTTTKPTAIALMAGSAFFYFSARAPAIRWQFRKRSRGWACHRATARTALCAVRRQTHTELAWQQADRQGSGSGTLGCMKVGCMGWDWSMPVMSCISAVRIQILGLVGAALSSASLDRGTMVRVLTAPRGRRRGHPGGHPLSVLRIDLNAEEESGVRSGHVSLHTLLQLRVHFSASGQ